MTTERMHAFALAVTAQTHEEARGRTRALRAMVVKLSNTCQRAGVPAAFTPESVIDRIQTLEEQIPGTDYLRCGLLVGEAEDIAREPLNAVDASLTILFRENRRNETSARATVQDAAAARLKAIELADRALEHSLKVARTRCAKEAHGSAVLSIWFQFITFGVVICLIGALIAMRLPADSAQQQQGLMIAVALGFGLPLALYGAVKCQSPGLDDWLRLAEEKEFAREFPRKEEALKLVRQAAVDAADRKHKEASGASQRAMVSIQADIDCLYALQEQIMALRTQTGL